jgi:hypothetical protein
MVRLGDPAWAGTVMMDPFTTIAATNFMNVVAGGRVEMASANGTLFFASADLGSPWMRARPSTFAMAHAGCLFRLRHDLRGHRLGRAHHRIHGGGRLGGRSPAGRFGMSFVSATRP